jgi:YidC/Oxa1 family membrane protein insertase
VDQRRVWLAVCLSLLLLFLYQELVVRRYQTEPIPPPETASQPTRTQPTPESQPTPAAEQPAPPAAGGFEAPAAGDAVIVETEVLRATLTPTGARLAALELKHYRETVAADSPPLALVTPDHPLLPLTVDLGQGRSDAGIVYVADQTRLEVAPGQEGEVIFRGTTADGVTLEKRFRFRGSDYLFDVELRPSGNGAPARLGLLMGAIERPSVVGTQRPEQAIALAEGRLVNEDLKNLASEPKTLTQAKWAGFGSQYFVGVMIPSPAPSEAFFGALGQHALVRVYAPVQEGIARFKAFLGPKEHAVLENAGFDLSRALDFGWFWFVAIPLLALLRQLHRVTGNYGVDIILLTTLVKVVTAPLTQTSFKNMRAMQKLQPQLQRLREQYKDDQAKLQQEMMELYRRNKVNPFSGCVPMLLQMPIFVGLYNALMYSIELRHAPFMLWIQDLSAPDRLMIPGLPFGVPVLTLVMGLSMLAQQWMTPAQGDPTQQRMMMFMPVIFTFMFINFPAGLVLYWLVNNVLSIGQQWFLLRKS